MIPEIERRGKAEKATPSDKAVINFMSLSRMLIEVFTRKNFGHRYHSIGNILLIELVLLLFPFISYRLWPGYELRKSSYGFLEVYWTWYVFMAVFFVRSLYHISQDKNTRNDEHTSYWWGDPHPLFYKIGIRTRPTDRLVAILYEPLLFIIIGKFLQAYDQKLGTLLIVCSVTFALQSSIKFQNYNDYIEDQKDSRIKGINVSKELTRPLSTKQQAMNSPSSEMPRDTILQSEKRMPKKKQGGNGRAR